MKYFDRICLRKQTGACLAAVWWLPLTHTAVYVAYNPAVKQVANVYLIDSNCH